MCELGLLFRQATVHTGREHWSKWRDLVGTSITLDFLDDCGERPRLDLFCEESATKFDCYSHNYFIRCELSIFGKIKRIVDILIV